MCTLKKFHFFIRQNKVTFVWRKCGIFCLGRYEFDRIRKNGKKSRCREFELKTPEKWQKKWYTHRDLNPKPSGP